MVSTFVYFLKETLKRFCFETCKSWVFLILTAHDLYRQIKNILEQELSAMDKFNLKYDKINRGR